MFLRFNKLVMAATDHDLAGELGDIELEDEEEPEHKENTVCAKLILSHEQVFHYKS